MVLNESTKLCLLQHDVWLGWPVFPLLPPSIRDWCNDSYKITVTPNIYDDYNSVDIFYFNQFLSKLQLSSVWMWLMQQTKTDKNAIFWGGWERRGIRGRHVAWRLAWRTMDCVTRVFSPFLPPAFFRAGLEGSLNAEPVLRASIRPSNTPSWSSSKETKQNSS